MPQKKITTTQSSSPAYIVGIGASAGGLEAISTLFDNMPDNTGFAFIIIQHLSPDHKSLMVDLLSKHTAMPVIEAEDAMALKPNCMYVIPSKSFMTVEGGKLHLQEKVKSKMPNNAIDIFFESLAEENGKQAIGIVLSGTGSDGSKGIEAIRKHGGVVVVQDPLTAAFDGMPNSALATGTADLTASPDTLADELIEFLNESPDMNRFHEQNKQAEFIMRDLLLKIRDSTGLNFSYYKRPTLYRRLAKRMSELAITDIRDYVTYLDTHQQELEIISKEFLINVSSFFRNPEAFEALRTQVIPTLIKNKKTDDSAKIWSVACSTGEEVYSLAILFKEYLAKNNLPDFNVKIFATDIDKDALETASRGVYSKNIVADVPAGLLARYFVPEGNTYKIHPDIRKMVVFSYHDILKDPPFSRVDLVSCRNMLIYIHPEKQKEILRKLHFALNVDGYLFLGPSENIGLMKNAIQEIDKKWKIYRIITRQALEEHNSIFAPLEKRSIALPQQKIKNAFQHISELFINTLLEDRKYGGIFITQEFEVKQAVGNYKNFIDFPEAGFNFNLLKLVKPDLAIALGVAVRKAIKNNDKVVMKGVKVRDNDKEKNITVIVKPHLGQKDYAQMFLFVVLCEEDEQEVKKAPLTAGSFESEERVADLEKELAETRANLQAVIEEVETSNEELISSNEEMISTNEELQSTNEELQSLNEELHTVSAEHQLKIKELSELNDDLNNYFRNSNVGQILIDRKLIIRRFTPAVTRMINLIDSDINRSILDITTKMQGVDFVQLIKEVMESEESIEMEITLNNVSTFLMRVSPYIRQDSSIDGVVVNFIDITEVKKLHSMMKAVFDSSASAINVKRTIRDDNNEIVDFEYITANSSQEKFLNIPPGSLAGKRLSTLTVKHDHVVRFKQVVETGELQQYDWYDEENDKWYEIVLTKMMDGLVTTATDITDKKKAADLISQSYADLKATSGKLAASNTKLERSNMDLLQFASVASHDLKEPLRKIETFGNLLHAKAKDRFENGDLIYLEKIIKSSSRMKTLIEDVLTLSKLSNEQLATQKVDLNKTLERIKDDLEITIKEKNAEVTIGKLPIVKAVPGQMHQLFQNLISNALKFNDRKQPVVSIAQKDIPEKILAEFKINAASYHCISIKDNGIGFEDEFKEKIFGIFQRLHGSQYNGTGIGLAICKKIVETHHGFLFAEAKLHEGAEFIVILPA